jgi:hypothetical protein
MQAAYFLNVDLEIQSTSKLDSLAKAMGRRVFVLHSEPGPDGRHFLLLEISRTLKCPDATIHAFCEIVESLPPAAKAYLERSNQRIRCRIRVASHRAFFALLTPTGHVEAHRQTWREINYHVLSG